MSRLCVAVVVVCALGAVGCGGSRRVSRPVAPAPAVRLSVAAPDDQATTLSTAVSVRGTVSPADATVLVRGRAAVVQAGHFAAQVPLAPGTNVIDVLAGAPGAAGAVGAVRVYRELPVTVPELAGASPSSAAASLGQLGLRPTVVDTGGFLQKLLPASKSVCRTVPAAGASLPPGSAVRVEVAKIC